MSSWQLKPRGSWLDLWPSLDRMNPGGFHAVVKSEDMSVLPDLFTDGEIIDA